MAISSQFSFLRTLHRAVNTIAGTKTLSAVSPSSWTYMLLRSGPVCGVCVWIIVVVPIYDKNMQEEDEVCRGKLTAGSLTAKIREISNFDGCVAGQ